MRTRRKTLWSENCKKIFYLTLLSLVFPSPSSDDCCFFVWRSKKSSLLSLHHQRTFFYLLLFFFSFSPLPFGRQKFLSGRECARHTSHDKNISHKKLKFFFYFSMRKTLRKMKTWLCDEMLDDFPLLRTSKKAFQSSREQFQAWHDFSHTFTAFSWWFCKLNFSSVFPSI